MIKVDSTTPLPDRNHDYLVAFLGEALNKMICLEEFYVSNVSWTGKALEEQDKVITSLEKKIADQDLKTTEMFGAMMDKFEKQEAQMAKLEEKILQLEETSCSEDPFEASKVATTVEAPFAACIDDIDCRVKGDGYACFMYICYPWEDDTVIPAQFR